MSKLTKYGVCYDLTQTPYRYEWRGITYCFSSRLHMKHFVRDVTTREEWLDDSLSRRFKCTCHLPILADIQLYANVETRGFHIVTDEGVEYESAASVYVEPNMVQIGVGHGSF